MNNRLKKKFLSLKTELEVFCQKDTPQIEKKKKKLKLFYLSQL